MRESRETTAASRRSNPNAPQGTQVAFLQTTGSFSQTIAGWTPGSYQISFQAAQRAGNHQNFYVLVDGNSFGNFTPAGSSYASYTTHTFQVTVRHAHHHLPGRGHRRGRQHRLHRRGDDHGRRRGRRHRGPADEHRARPDHPARHHRLGRGPIRQSRPGQRRAGHDLDLSPARSTPS